MSKKSKRRAAQKLVAQQLEREQREAARKRREEKAPKSKKKAIIISSISAFLVVAIVVGIVMLGLSNKAFDYMSSDLSDYIEISEEDYKSYTVEARFDKVTEKDVERKIMALLFANKGEFKNNGATIYRERVSVGDVVNIYYRGYTVDENGREIDFEGGTNMLGEQKELGIGSLSFVPGFEEGLIGAIPWDHHYNPETDRVTTGLVEDGDVIYMSYKVMYPDGKSEQKTNVRIDLSDEKCDDMFGKGFSGYIEGKVAPVGTTASRKQIGTKILENATFPYDENGAVVYTDMIINSAVRCPNEPITVDAHFPANHTAPELRGCDVKYDVYFNGMVCYDVPEYNEAFITDTLKISAEDLAKYEGDSIIEKHRASLLDEAERDTKKINDAVIEEAMWAHYNDKVQIKKLPESEVNAVYLEFFTELQQEYQIYYSTMFKNAEEYARSKYNLTAYDSVTEHIRGLAEEIVVEKILFYYILREENLIPDEQTFEQIYERIVKEYLDYHIEAAYEEELEKIENEDEKNRRVEEIRAEMIEYYGRQYFVELVYYDYAFDTIVSFATVVEK